MWEREQLLTLVVLVGFALALAAWIVAELRRSPYTPLQSALYFVNVLMTRVLWRCSIVGHLDVPPGKGAVFVCNHRSSVDPCFIQLLAGRVVHWMVAAEYFPLPVVGSVLRFTGSIPARRGGIDTASTRQAIRYASLGELVGMLPEGRINETPLLMLPGRPGAVLVALKAHVPIIPCYLHGARYAGTFWSSMVMPAKVRLTIGPPLDLSEFHDQEPTADLLGLLTRRMMSEIAKLAGRPDFEPQLAGRHWKPKPGNTDRL